MIVFFLIVGSLLAERGGAIPLAQKGRDGASNLLLLVKVYA